MTTHPPLRTLIDLVTQANAGTLCEAAGDARSYVVPIEAYGQFYHGGPSAVREIDPSLLQQMDSGYYGEGFYAGKTWDFAASWSGAGSIVTTFTLRPGSRILKAGVDGSKAADGLLQALRDFHYTRSLKAIETTDGRARKEAEQKLSGQLELLAFPHHVSHYTKIVNDFARELRVQGIDRGEEVVIIDHAAYRFLYADRAEAGNFRGR